MLNLLRMDLYRILRSKSFYVGLGILLLTNLMTFGILFIITDPDARELIIRYGAEVTSDAAAIREALSVTSILDVFDQSAIAGGFFSVILGILTSLFVCMDFDSGFIKNILASHENKWDYILSKTVSLSLVNFLYLAVSFVFTLLLNILSRGFFKDCPLGDSLFYLFSSWMIVNAFSALALLICTVTRSKAAGVAGAICLNSGLISMIASGILGLFGFDWIMDYTLYMTLSSLPTHFDGSYTLRPFITGLIFWVLYILVSKIVLSRKDI